MIESKLVVLLQLQKVIFSVKDSAQSGFHQQYSQGLVTPVFMAAEFHTESKLNGVVAINIHSEVNLPGASQVDKYANSCC